MTGAARGPVVTRTDPPRADLDAILREVDYLEGAFDFEADLLVVGYTEDGVPVGVVAGRAHPNQIAVQEHCLMRPAHTSRQRLTAIVDAWDALAWSRGCRRAVCGVEKASRFRDRILRLVRMRRFTQYAEDAVAIWMVRPLLRKERPRV